jgi:DNA-binding LacI/PurR family transcriptional regulator
MQDVAAAAGCSRAAVSMALRDDPSIPEKTRRRIRAVAEQLGYRPSPLVAALMSLRRRRRSSLRDTTAIAFIDSHSPTDPSNRHFSYRRMLSGARARATDLGFRIEVFPLHRPGEDAAHLRSVLDVRHIRAAIAAPLPHGETHLDFDARGLALVGLGLSVHSPLVDRVSVDLFRSASDAVAHCIARGYRRPGLVLSQETSERLEHRWLGGYRCALGQHGLDSAPPPLMPAKTGQLAAALPEWLRSSRPDVVILGNAEPELPGLIPRTLGLVSLSVEFADGEQTGIFEDHSLLGSIASELVIGRLQQNRLDLLDEARMYLFAGKWIEGRTAPGPRQRR